MTTKTVLKARIADDIARSDLTTQIGEAIDDAITHYKSRRFYFTETRSATFATVAAQSTYSSSDDADVPLFIKLDGVSLVDSSSLAHRLERYDPERIEFLLDSSAPSGRPYAYAYFDQSFRLYPIPDAVYTVRPFGHIERAGPATDGEASNVWMVNAFELIRCRAKAYLYTHVIRQMDKAALMQEAEGQALSALTTKTTKQTALGRIEASDF